MLKPALISSKQQADERRIDPVQEYGNRFIQQGLFDEDETEVDLTDDTFMTCDTSIDPPRNGRVRCDFEIGVCDLKCEDGFKPVGCKSKTECLCNAEGCDWTTLGRNCICQSEKNNGLDR